ncbi:MAG: NTP transferase domain-containing protein [Chlorobi bacterium]|nr:NTP transferase domain-containing protein [Chlorobiota bacterium]
MKGVIMAGGFGTRLRPLTCNLPKPMAPMANRPMMHHIVNLLKGLGIREIMSLLYYQPESISSYFGNGSAFDIEMFYTKAEADFGTAGSVRNASTFLDERFIVISGDVLTDFDLKKTIAFHEAKGAPATLVLTRVPDPLAFGVVMTDEEGKITRFLEKPQWGEVFSDTINTGIYILEPEVLDLIPYKQDFDFSKDLFPMMLEQNMGLYGFIGEGYWRDVGNLEEYQQAHFDILTGEVRIEFPGTEKGPIWIDGSPDIGENVAFEEKVILGKNTTIESGATIINSVIGDKSHVGAGAIIRDSVIWQGTRIGRNSQLTNDVLCEEVSLGDDVVISEKVYIADRCIIGNEARLLANIKLWPDKEVESRSTVSASLVWADRWTRELFTNARITGLSNIEMTPEFGAKLGSAMGAFAGKGRSIAISRDADNVSRMIHRAMTTGLMSAGVIVNDLQQTPIPLTRSELRNGKQAAGMHIRKSPHDRRKTDIIFFSADGRDMPPSLTKSIERLFFGEEYQRASYNEVGSIFFPERTNEAYITSFLQVLDEDAIRAARMNVALDFSYGVASTILPNILGALGPEVVAVNGYQDPTRMAREREEIEAAQKKLGEVVTSLGYDMGFIIDPGAEKIYAVCETGDSIHNYRLLSILTKLYLETHPAAKKIAVPVVASTEVELIAADYEVEVVYTKNTHLAMMEATSNPDIEFVGGTRGGFIFPEFLFAIDGMYAVAKIMEMTAKSGLSLGQLDRDLPHRAVTERTIDCLWELKGRTMRRAMEHSEGMRRQLIDGVKIWLDDHDWVLLIPDKERPCFHVVVETAEAEKSAQLALEYEKLVREWKQEEAVEVA